MIDVDLNFHQMAASSLYFMFLITAKFNRMKSCPNTYFITVVVDTELDLIIGAGSIIVEQKFIHDCGEVSSLPFSEG